MPQITKYLQRRSKDTDFMKAFGKNTKELREKAETAATRISRCYFICYKDGTQQLLSWFYHKNIWQFRGSTIYNNLFLKHVLMF